MTDKISLIPNSLNKFLGVGFYGVSAAAASIFVGAVTFPIVGITIFNFMMGFPLARSAMLSNGYERWLSAGAVTFFTISQVCATCLELSSGIAGAFAKLPSTISPAPIVIIASLAIVGQGI